MGYIALEELVFWKQAREFRKKIADLIKIFPKEEKFRLTDQIIRSSRSVTANIAEGHGRFHYQENIQYCRIARGSLTETLDHLIVAYDEGYISENHLLQLKEDYIRLLKIANGYIAFLKKEKLKQKYPQ